MTKVFFFFVLICIFSCAQPAADSQKGNDSETTQPTRISAKRDKVRKEAIAHYSFKLPNDLNNWAFKVELKETADRHAFLMQLTYQEVTGEDTIRLPNLNIEPQPAIKKGKSNLDCIIGFMDNKNVFREYISVGFVDDALNVKTLKHYAFSETPAAQ